MMDYEMEELLPIVAELAEAYTSRESTSISYEKARQLMEAVIYCIEQCKDDHLPVTGALSAKEAYGWGYKKVVERVQKTQAVYNGMIEDFLSYGNENYYDTVTKAIPGFFLYYDARFAPQETLITMDYPVLCPMEQKTGICGVETYVTAIVLEQKFLHKLPKEYVETVLYRFHKGYRRQFFNITSVLLRNVLGCITIGKPLSVQGETADYDKLGYIISESNRVKLEQRLCKLLEILIEKEYGKDKELNEYLKNDVKDFVAELYMGQEYKCLDKKVVL